MTIYIGTCGFSYKDWIGPFYPGSIRNSEMLEYYAQRFAAVEIDSSYYGVPEKRVVERMMARTPQTFRFCFKAPATVTHPADASAETIHSDAAALVDSLQPALQSGKLGSVLVQFPNGFRDTERNRRYLRRAVEALQGVPLVAEFRNREWQTGSALELLRELGVGWCNVDMPSYETLLHPSSDVTAAVGYVRFHGRNAAKWWTGDNRTRYDYAYDAEELEPWTARVAEIEDEARTVFAFFNNHARGNATRNAELFTELLRGRYGQRAAEVLPAPTSIPAQDDLFSHPGATLPTCAKSLDMA